MHTATESDDGLGRHSTTLTRREWIALSASALGYNVMHHSGVFFGTAPAGADTRIADWIDLLTPFVVLGPLAWFLAQRRASVATSVVFGVGAVIYVQGHGIHLSANSISNVVESPGSVQDVVHLWDEVVGHYIWYAGAFVCALAAVASVHGRSLRANIPSVVVASALTGLTWATNGLEGGTAVFSLVLASAAVGYGVWHRRGAAMVVIVAGTVAAVILAGYGIRYGGFPQPSSR